MMASTLQDIAVDCLKISLHDEGVFVCCNSLEKKENEKNKNLRKLVNSDVVHEFSSIGDPSRHSLKLDHPKILKWNDEDFTVLLKDQLIRVFTAVFNYRKLNRCCIVALGLRQRIKAILDRPKKSIQALKLLSLFSRIHNACFSGTFYAFCVSFLVVFAFLFGKSFFVSFFGQCGVFFFFRLFWNFSRSLPQLFLPFVFVPHELTSLLYHIVQVFETEGILLIFFFQLFPNS